MRDRTAARLRDEPARPLVAAIDSERLARIFKALSHPVRVEIVSSLAACSGAVCGDIVRGLPLAQSTVSQHLAILREAGLIEAEESGRCCHYRLTAGAWALVEGAVGALFAAHCRGEAVRTDEGTARMDACRKDTE
ncbi:ArsR/SmtB family transcription factor [Stappia indica]|uniref:ArsR/SmtB family transcription factor n=1 Tax=Stappia indica TaxID=538381 RepID=UPI00082BF653|nr:metalloregulator ArsR/SmtB family transcription factor [Stappia indica]